MSDRSGFFEASRKKRRDSGYVWNHGVFYFGDLFSYSPLAGSEGAARMILYHGSFMEVERVFP